jgi:hypothetical protein
MNSLTRDIKLTLGIALTQEIKSVTREKKFVHTGTAYCSRKYKQFAHAGKK